jgi:S-(hydroxymethyl)glutathione dehydrogenase/alcohol dehydrogenase
VKTRAAVVHQVDAPIEVIELELDGPYDGEVLVRWLYSGMCHSDLHVVTGHFPMQLPFVLGHEGAGIVEQIGPGVTRVAPGDHVVSSFMPSCGHCRWCATGRQPLCDLGATNRLGHLPNGRYPFTGPGGQYGAMCTVGTFSQYAVCTQTSLVRIDDDLPMASASLVACGVPTGWGSSVYAADVQPGETVVIIGTGGVGMNAVQGARHAGAHNLIAVDPVALKREQALEFGATHAVSSIDEAAVLALELTRGVGADKAVITTDLVTEEQITGAFRVIGKGGTLVITSANKFDLINMKLPAAELTLFRKTLKGTVFGDCNPTADIPMLLGMYQAGQLKLDELITRRYSLDEVAAGYDDLLAGEIVRGLLVHEH